MQPKDLHALPCGACGEDALALRCTQTLHFTSGWSFDRQSPEDPVFQMRDLFLPTAIFCGSCEEEIPVRGPEDMDPDRIVQRLKDQAASLGPRPGPLSGGR